MNTMRHFLTLPFAMTTLSVLLSACGGGSNTINSNATNSNSTNYCSSTDASCVDIVFDDTPVANLNFECGVYRGLTSVTGVARCPIDSTVTYYLKAPNGVHVVTLGSFNVKSVRNVTATEAADTSLIRIGVKELAENTNTGASMSSLDDGSLTATTALNISRLLQTLGRSSEPFVATAPVNRIYIDSDIKVGIDKMTSDVSAIDFQTGAFADKVKPWLDVEQRTLLSSSAIKQRLQETITAGKAGSYYSNPIGLLSGLINSTNIGVLNVNLGISGSSMTSTSGASAYSSIGLFTVQNRAGQNFGYGMQWKGSSNTPADLYKLFMESDFAKMRVNSGSNGIDPYSNRFKNFALKVSTAAYTGQAQYDDTFTQGDTFSFVNGKLIRDLAVVGSPDVYKLYTGVVVSDQKDLGSWDQFNTNGAKTYSGAATVMKTGAINTYLDREVWRVKDLVSPGQTYLFPLYTTFTFNFPQGYKTECANQGLNCGESQSVNVIFLENGDIVANSTVAADTATQQCTRDITKDIPVGTVRAAYLSQDGQQYYISPNIVMSDPSFGALDGMQVGTSALAPRVKINIAGIHAAPANTRGNINATSAEAIKDANGNVKVLPDDNLSAATWVNGYNTFINSRVYAATQDSSLPVTTKEQKLLAQLANGTLSVNTADCYKVLQK